MIGRILFLLFGKQLHTFIDSQKLRPKGFDGMKLAYTWQPWLIRRRGASPRRAGRSCNTRRVRPLFITMDLPTVPTRCGCNGARAMQRSAADGRRGLAHRPAAAARSH